MSKLNPFQKQMIAFFLEENFADFCDHLDRHGAVGPDRDAESFGEQVVEILNEEAEE
ncbi:MAG: hypothetical protein ACRCXB_25025 [Aeromonadaceae bacterium]